MQLLTSEKHSNDSQCAAALRERDFHWPLEKEHLKQRNWELFSVEATFLCCHTLQFHFMSSRHTCMQIDPAGKTELFEKINKSKTKPTILNVPFGISQHLSDVLWAQQTLLSPQRTQRKPFPSISLVDVYGLCSENICINCKAISSSCIVHALAYRHDSSVFSLKFLKLQSSA